MKAVKGFTLIELMIVVAIIGLLAMIAVPTFGRYVAKAKRAEAYMNLSSIYAAQKAYAAEHGRYGASLQEIGWQPSSTKKMYYEYAISNAGPKSFTATAIGDIDADEQLDELMVDENNTITIVKDDLLVS